MARNQQLITVIIVSGLIAWPVFATISWTGFNSLFFIDNFVYVPVVFSPVFMWSILGLVLGGLIGLVIGVRKLRLNPKLIMFGSLICATLFIVTGFISEPFSPNRIFLNLGNSGATDTVAIKSQSDSISRQVTAQHPLDTSKVYLAAAVNDTSIPKADTTKNNLPVPELKQNSNSSESPTTNLHPYGEGNGSLTILNTYSSYNNIAVSIDDEFAGKFTQWYAVGVTPVCGTANGAAITLALKSGFHSITAFDDANNTWACSVVVKADECLNFTLTGLKKNEPIMARKEEIRKVSDNPFGEGKGRVCFWTSDNIIYKIIVDGTDIGTLDKHFITTPKNCGERGTVTRIFKTGSHSLELKGNGRDETSTFEVSDGECTFEQVTN